MVVFFRDEEHLHRVREGMDHSAWRLLEGKRVAGTKMANSEIASRQSFDVLSRHWRDCGYKSKRTAVAGVKFPSNVRS